MRISVRGALRTYGGESVHVCAACSVSCCLLEPRAYVAIVDGLAACATAATYSTSKAPVSGITPNCHFAPSVRRVALGAQLVTAAGLQLSTLTALLSCPADAVTPECFADLMPSVQAAGGSAVGLVEIGRKLPTVVNRKLSTVANREAPHANRNQCLLAR